MIDPLGEDDLEGTLHGRFRAVARALGARPAVEGAGALSYEELDRRANGLAHAIAAHPAAADGAPVVLLLRQGATSVVATLGALAAGRTYVPLDPDDPPARLAGVAGLVGARLVLTDRECAPRAEALAAAGAAVVVVDDAATARPAPPGVRVAPDAPAYVYFTSGSTGAPKGVVDTHRNVLHNALRYTEALAITSADRLSLLQPPSLSAVVSSTFAALLNGAALVPLRLEGGRIAGLGAEVRSRRVTVYHSVPSIFRSMLALDDGGFPDVRVVRLEGDRASSLDVALHRGRFRPDSVLANGLGATETGLCRQLRLPASGPAPAEGALPVGFAVRDVEVDVVDPAGRPLPPGATGEIAVRSRHLALGYWGRPDLTAAAFAPDPADPAGRVYRTGDLGRLGPDGCLELLGRRDGELKVLGHRVEPSEVEAELLALPGVTEAAVTTYAGRRGEGRLAAHVVVDGAGLDHIGLGEALRARLPAHMVPATVAFVESLPLTAAGKVDRVALAPPPGAGVGAAGADEAGVVRLFERVLERPGIGRDDDFYAMGGDSLAAAELLAGLEALTGRGLSESLLVRAPTAAGLAAELRAGGGGRPAAGVAPLQPIGRGAPLVLVHGLDFSTNTYAWLVRRLGMARPVWGLDAPPGGGRFVAALARDHAAALRAAEPDGPHMLAAFCSGAIIAVEVARALRAEGADVPVLALIGIGAADFPGLVSPAAAARHRAQGRLLRRLRRDGPIGLARELRPRRRPPAAVVVARHAPSRLPGAAALYLSAEATAPYSDDPLADWAGLADAVRVEVVPGPNEGLLEEPAVADTARWLRAAMDAADPPEPRAR